jgi:hypothetical protein
VKTHYKWPFSIAMLNYQRVIRMNSQGIPTLGEIDQHDTRIEGYSEPFWDHLLLATVRSFRSHYTIFWTCAVEDSPMDWVRWNQASKEFEKLHGSTSRRKKARKPPNRHTW